MVDYNYLEGLVVLGYLDLNLGINKLKLFEEEFNYYYNVRKGMSGIMDFISFLSIIENAYISTISDNNSNLENKLKQEFSEKVKLNLSVLKQMEMGKKGNKIIMSTMN
ncbi:MAG: hypothetical protein AABX61_00485 [Nanoarchaeota archaeon]